VVISQSSASRGGRDASRRESLRGVPCSFGQRDERRHSHRRDCRRQRLIEQPAQRPGRRRTRAAGGALRSCYRRAVGVLNRRESGGSRAARFSGSSQTANRRQPLEGKFRLRWPRLARTLAFDFVQRCRSEHQSRIRDGLTHRTAFRGRVARRHRAAQRSVRTSSQRTSYRLRTLP
jgi:hypothetical protein